MKLTLIAFCLFCATSAFSQSASVLSGDPQPLLMSDHLSHASQHDLAAPQSILADSSYTYEKGERPISEFTSPLPRPTPLGDIARAYRHAHRYAPKAEVVFEKYVADEKQ